MTTRFYDAMTALAPVHWWRMHDASVATENDVGSDPDSDFGSITGSVTSRQAGPLEAGETTYSAQFASGGYMIRTAALTSNDFAGTTDGSWVVFFKTPASSTLQWVFGAHPDDRQFSLYISSGGELYFVQIEGASARSTISTVAGLDDNAWHMAAMVCNGTDANRLFVDGEETTVSYFGTSLANNYWLSSTTYGGFRVGDDTRAPSTSFPFTGYISELAFFSYPLSATNIFDLYAASQPPVAPPTGAGGHRYKGRRTFAGF